MAHRNSSEVTQKEVNGIRGAVDPLGKERAHPCWETLRAKEGPSQAGGIPAARLNSIGNVSGHAEHQSPLMRQGSLDLINGASPIEAIIKNLVVF